MSDHEAGDDKHEHESPLLHAQEHKGYGDDEGERDELPDAGGGRAVRGGVARPRRTETATERLAAVRRPLLDLHRQVLASERVDLERFQGRLSGSEFLQIATDNLALAWLLPLTELIVEIDEALEDASATDERVDALLAKARELLAPPSPQTPFGRRYLGLLQRRPEVVVAHGAVLGALRAAGTSDRPKT